MFEAASKGATSAVGLVVTVVVNLMVFISLMSFLDGILAWFGGLFDCPQLSFSVMVSNPVFLSSRAPDKCAELDPSLL